MAAPPRFTVIHDGEPLAVRELWSWPKRHRVLDHPTRERLFNAWPGLHKRHGLGRVAGGHLYYELLILR